jgi:hypothetical protein
MDNATDITARTQRFNEAARAFTPPSPTRHAKLAPFKDGIVELRQKGASLRLIRELLATASVAVGTDTIARFLDEVNGEATPQRSAKRTERRRPGAPRTTLMQPAAAPPDRETPSQLPAPVQPPATPPQPDTASDRSRSRGPRIADPRSL